MNNTKKLDIFDKLYINLIAHRFLNIILLISSQDDIQIQTTLCSSKS